MAGRRTLYRTTPPYNGLEATSSLDCTPGTIFCFPVPADVPELTAIVSELRAAAPAAALVGSCPDLTSCTETAGFAASVLGIPTLPDEALSASPGAELRRALSAPEVLRSGFRYWLRCAGRVNDNRISHLLWGVVIDATVGTREEVPDGLELPRARIPEMAASLRLSPRGLRSACSRQQLPAPVRWKRLARLLVVAQAAQRDPARSLTDIAIAYGFTDLPALDSAFRRCLDCTPSFVRERLGWEWITHRWLLRHRN